MYAVLYVNTYGNCIKEDCWLEGVDYINVRVFRDLEDAKEFAKEVYEDGAEFAIVVPILFVKGVEIEGELIVCE